MTTPNNKPTFKIPSPPPKESKKGNNNNDSSHQIMMSYKNTARKLINRQNTTTNNNNNKAEDDDNNDDNDDLLFMNVTTWQRAAIYERAETLSSLMNNLVFSRLFSKDVFDITVVDETLVVSGATHLTAAGVTEELQRQALSGNVGVKATLIDPEKVKLAGSRQIGICLDGFVSHHRRLLFEKVLGTIEEKYLKDVICKVRYSLREGDELPAEAMLYPLFTDLIDIKVKRFWNRAAWGVRSGLVHQIGEVRRGIRQKAASSQARKQQLQQQQQGSSLMSNSNTSPLFKNSGNFSSSGNNNNASSLDKSMSLATNAAALAATANEEVANSNTPSSRRSRPFCSTNEYYVAVTQDGLPINRVWLGAFPTLFVFWATWDDDSVQFLRNWYSGWNQGDNFFHHHHHHNYNSSSASVNDNNNNNNNPEQEQQQQIQLLLQQDPWFMWAARFLDPADIDFHAVRNPAPPLGSDDATITKHIRIVLQRISLLIGELHNQHQQQLIQQQKQMLQTDVSQTHYRNMNNNSNKDDDTPNRNYSRSSPPRRYSTAAAAEGNSSYTTPASVPLTAASLSALIRSLCQVVFINCDLDKTRAMDAVADMEREFFKSSSSGRSDDEDDEDHDGSSNHQNKRSSSSSKYYKHRRNNANNQRRKNNENHGKSNGNNNKKSASRHGSHANNHDHLILKRCFNSSFVRTSHYWLGADSVQSVLCETLDIRSFPTLVSTTNKGVVHFVYEFASYDHTNPLNNSGGDNNKNNNNFESSVEKVLRNTTMNLTKPNDFGGDDVLLGTQLDRHVYLVARDLAVRRQRRKFLRQQQLMREKGLITAVKKNNNNNIRGNNTTTEQEDSSLLQNNHNPNTFGAGETEFGSMTMMSHQNGDFTGLGETSSSNIFGGGLGATAASLNLMASTLMTGGGGTFNNNQNDLNNATTMFASPMLLTKEAEDIIKKRGEAAAAVREAMSSLMCRNDNNNNIRKPSSSSSSKTSSIVTIQWYLLDDDIKESIINHLRAHLDVVDTPVTFEVKRIWCFDEISSSKSKMTTQNNNSGGVDDASNRTFRFLDRCMLRTKKEEHNGYVDWTRRIKSLEQKVSSEKEDPNDEMRIQVRIPDEFETVSRQVSKFILRGLISEITFETKLKPVLDLLLKACSPSSSMSRSKKVKTAKKRVTNTATIGSPEDFFNDDDDDDDQEEEEEDIDETQNQDDRNYYNQLQQENLGLDRHQFDIDLDVIMCCKPWTVWHANLNNPLLQQKKHQQQQQKTNNNNNKSSSSILSRASKNEITCQNCKKNVKFSEAPHFECLHCFNYAAAAAQQVLSSTSSAADENNKKGEGNNTTNNNNNNNSNSSSSSSPQQQQQLPPTVLCYTCGSSFVHNPSHVLAFFPAGSEYDDPIRTIWGRENVNPLPQKRSIFGDRHNHSSLSSTPFSDMYYTSLSTKNSNNVSTTGDADKKHQHSTTKEKHLTSSSTTASVVEGHQHQNHHKQKDNNNNNNNVDTDDNENDINNTNSSSFSLTGIHAGIYCDSCRATIKGARWKCAVCYDIDLCDVCFNEFVVDVPRWGMTEGAQRMMMMKAPTTTTGVNSNNNNNHNKTLLVSSEEPPNPHGGDSRDGRRRLCHYSHVFLRIAKPTAGGSDGSFILPEVRKVTREELKKL